MAKVKEIGAYIIFGSLIIYLFSLLLSIAGYARFGRDYVKYLALYEEGIPTIGGSYYLGIDKYWCLHPDSCPHERGHQIDRFHQYSSQPEFRDAVDTINSCAQDYGSLVDNQTWLDSSIRLLYEEIHSFPGLYGNPMRNWGEGEWGDYSELYADLYRLRLDLGFESARDITPMVVQYAEYCLDEVERIRNE